MNRLLFDIETNGFLDQLDTIHCLVIQDLDTNEIYSCSDAPPMKTDYTPLSIDEGVFLLQEAEELWGHNIQDFDIPAIKKVKPNFQPKGRIRDTLIISRLIWTNLSDLDASFQRKKPGRLEKKNVGRHSLEAWGQRLGLWKGDFKGPWDAWTQTMHTYCEQDVKVNRKLVDKIVSKKYSETAIQLEHDFAKIIRIQESHGVLFDVKKAQGLTNTMLKEKQELEKQLINKYFPDRFEQVGTKPVEVKSSRLMRKGLPWPVKYTKGCSYSKIKLVQFNPNSGDHIAKRFKEKHNWKPKKFTESGKAAVDEQVLSSLEYPEAKHLLKIALLNKRLGLIYSGTNGWLKKYVEKTGRLHGYLNTNGAVTGRCTHRVIANIPRVTTPYGREIRELFKVPEDSVLVGFDASGLELRCLSHYMTPYDGGKYRDILLTGDIHTENQVAADLPTRNDAKTFIYAFL